MKPMNKLIPIALTSILALTLTACGTMSEKIVTSEIEDVRQGPKADPVRNITNFSEALRCMDNEFLRYKVRNVKILVENMEDNTGEIKTGTKDMLIAAVSDMSRRSRAIQLIAYGSDSGNLISFLSSAGRQSQFSEVPKYDIRGSISQMDKEVVKHEADTGVALEKFGGGIGGSAGGSILGLDLSVLNTENMAVIPGVHSRNSVVVMTSGTGLGGDATIKKAGVSFSFVFAKAEGPGQAVRNLVELASIELMGKLFKIAYWNCLGLEKGTLEVKNEMEDWYYAMDANSELVPYLESQLRNRGFYDQAPTGKKTPQLMAAVNQYRQALGMKKSNKIDLAFFDAFLNQPTPELGNTAVAEVSGSGIKIKGSKKPGPFSPGERVDISISTEDDSYLYCFYRDENNRIIRFFPNRFQRSPFVAANSSLEIPGKMPFEINASKKGVSETVGCYRASSDIFDDLPLLLRGKDFEPLRVLSLDEIKDSFQGLAGGDFGEGYFFIDTVK